MDASRSGLVFCHKVVGALIPVVGYVQIVLGVIASVGFCYDGKATQFIEDARETQIGVCVRSYWPMPRPLYYGFVLCRIWYYFIVIPSCRCVMDAATKQEPRMVR